MAVAKLAALTEPNPVARSYPAAAENAGARVLSTITPVALPLLWLQLSEPATQGTEILPLVTSLKMQPDPWVPLDVHEAPACAARL